MKRPAAQDKTLARIKKWREQCPELTLRSTFIVGFPARPIPILPICSTGSRKPRSIAPAASKYEPVAGAASKRSAMPCPTTSKRSAGMR